jgi:putative hydrolase of the HAD superfamily
VNTPKTVIFDIGKVLLDFDYTIAARKLIHGGKIGIAELSKLFTAPGEILLRYETGLVTTRQFYEHVCLMTGYSGDIEQFAACFGDIFSPIQPIIDAHAAIRQKGIPTCILSNTNELAMRHIRTSYPFIGDFDAMVLSYEHRAMKPSHEIYEAAERVCGFKGGDIAYVDDRVENIETAAQRGWRVVLQEQTPKTLSALRDMGVLD